jgi:hypothetical protein
MIHKIYKVHNDELAKIRSLLSNLSAVVDPDAASKLVALNASIEALDESLELLRQTIPTQIQESESRVVSVIEELRAKRAEENEVSAFVAFVRGAYHACTI